jgi:hypothetical protein
MSGCGINQVMSKHVTCSASKPAKPATTPGRDAAMYGYPQHNHIPIQQIQLNELANEAYPMKCTDNLPHINNC